MKERSLMYEGAAIVFPHKIADVVLLLSPEVCVLERRAPGFEDAAVDSLLLKSSSSLNCWKMLREIRIF